MFSLLLRYDRVLTLLLVALLGLCLGHLAATGLGVALNAPPAAPLETAPAMSASVKKPVLADYQPILDRNLFDSSARPGLSFVESAQSTQPAALPAAARMFLLGTVAGSARALAVIRIGDDVEVYHLGEELPGGGSIQSISRNALTIAYPGGREETLTLYVEGEAAAGSETTPPPTARAQASAPGVRSVGPNRWKIASEAVERARGDMGELMKQARLEPVVAEGRTQGFIVRMIQPRSLFAVLGLQRGDVIQQVNGVELDSPEKALQIFQQLREARNISLDLVRNGSPLSLTYEID